MGDFSVLYILAENVCNVNFCIHKEGGQLISVGTILSFAKIAKIKIRQVRVAMIMVQCE